jgi:hypothetical protein
MSQPDKYLGTVYSNFEREYDHEIVAALQRREGHADHCAWNFHAEIWLEDPGTADEHWVEEVSVHGSVRETFVGSTIQEVIDQANEKYGSE